jgi:hypothetical protein
MKKYVPGYAKLFQAGELDNRIKILNKRLKNCIVSLQSRQAK